MNTHSPDLVNEAFSDGPHTSPPPECAPEYIRRRAYPIFECRGREPGHELDDRLQAEHEIKTYLGLN